MADDDPVTVSRRGVLRTAVSVGGLAGLAACLEEEGDAPVPIGPDDLSGMPARQFAWNDVLRVDDHGNRVAPRHRVLLLLEYLGEGPPTPADRDETESALRTLERAYERSPEGLLFTVSYSPAYFDRFPDDLDDGVDLPEPEALAPFESPDPDRPDAVVHLASDRASVVLEAEEALRGSLDEANGRDVEATLDGIFRVADRRTGFVGAGLPADRQDVRGLPDSAPVPEDAPMFMGFKSDFRRNQASEDRVAIRDGPFADGTTQQLSRIRLHLDQWYEQDDRHHRVATMFCPAHAEEGFVDGVGDNLEAGGQVADRGCPERAEADARERGVVGHSQKTAAARVDGDSRLLRRDFNSTDGDRATLHFLSLQRTIADFVETREAMNGTDLASAGAVGRRTNNGILQYMTVERRGNYLLPPRSLRSLPPANP
ncbi:MAG: Tat pathway signal protein [Halobacteriales archaeon]